MHEETSIGELAQAIGKEIGVEIKVKTDIPRVRPSRSEVTQLHCDNTKIVTKSGWKPAYTLRQGLRETIGWTREHQGLFKLEIYNV